MRTADDEPCVEPGGEKDGVFAEDLRMQREVVKPCGTLVADLATDNDAKRLAEAGVLVKQIRTDGRCHLEADDW